MREAHKRRVRGAIKRKALNRGTAVHLGGPWVRFIWPCGCSKREKVKTPAGDLSASAVALLVRRWRENGVTLEECKKHPSWYDPKSQVARLNSEFPQEPV